MARDKRGIQQQQQQDQYKQQLKKKKKNIKKTIADKTIDLPRKIYFWLI
jgi:hypothetical protein